MRSNQALWGTTALFITYDEHDGYFDHVLPGSPEATVTNEFIGGLPVGFGPRVPMIICSPWTRGGFVDSNSYDHTFSIYGPDGFVRSFAGDIIGASTTTGQVPRVTGTPVTGPAPSLQLTLANDGTTAVTYTLTASDYAGTTQAVTVGANGSTGVTWPVDADGYYDVIITANTRDGFTRRYPGRIA